MRGQIYNHRGRERHQKAKRDVDAAIPLQTLHHVPPDSRVKGGQVDPNVEGAVFQRPSAEPQQNDED